MRVAFTHPDLGIGGAERLVVDAAVALQEENHSVHVYTSHHDTRHCFQETRDGTLDVTVRGDFLPQRILGRFAVLCAILRSIYLAFTILLFSRRKYDVIFCDQVSISIPILKLTGARILFYCHFPDKLLSQRDSAIKRLYRVPFDKLEEFTTGKADQILVNSEFTKSIFRQSFPTLHDCEVSVLYPAINFSNYDAPADASKLPVQLKKKVMFLSINRYERKKNVALAVEALDHLRKRDPSSFQDTELVIAGGYDELVNENREYYNELKAIVEQWGLEQHVHFVRSFSEAERAALMERCRAVIYTPENEHFGIVPVEAMYCKRAIVAVKSGGPRESVVHGKTGFLCEPTAEDFGKAMSTIAGDAVLASRLGNEGHQRAVDMFSLKTFGKKLSGYVSTLGEGKGKRKQQ